MGKSGREKRAGLSLYHGKAVCVISRKKVSMQGGLQTELLASLLCKN